MVRDRGPRFPMSSRGLSILTLHSPPAPQVMRTTRQRVIVDLIDAPERASSQEPQKVPPRRRTPSPASHAAVRLARIAPARLTARAHPDLSPRGPPRTYYDLAERLAGTPPLNARLAPSPVPLPRRRRSARPLRQLAGGHPLLSRQDRCAARIRLLPRSYTSTCCGLLPSNRCTKLGVDGNATTIARKERRRFSHRGDVSLRHPVALALLYGVPHTHTRPYRSYSARVDRHPAWSLSL